MLAHLVASCSAPLTTESEHLDLTSCGSAESGAAARLSGSSLVELSAWKLQLVQDDPLPAHRPQMLLCPPYPYSVERDGLELSTQLCPYFSMEQASLAAVRAGDPIRFALYHYDLVADSPGEAHVAILFAGALQWEQTFAIPSPANSYEYCFVANRDLVPGGVITLHLHNHGQNTWIVTDLSQAGEETAVR